MASSLGYIEFVCEQIRGFDNVRFRKMFGDYMVYVNDKPILLVCNNTVYVKKIDEVKILLEDAPCGIPYVGAREHYILDIENNDLTEEVAKILERNTSVPIKKIRNKQKRKHE